jgi:hypothetical protein
VENCDSVCLEKKKILGKNESNETVLGFCKKIFAQFSKQEEEKLKSLRFPSASTTRIAYG